MSGPSVTLVVWTGRELFTTNILGARIRWMALSGKEDGVEIPYPRDIMKQQLRYSRITGKSSLIP